MTAVVCDKCGKVVLIDDNDRAPQGISRVHVNRNILTIGYSDEHYDLCDECEKNFFNYIKGESND